MIVTSVQIKTAKTQKHLYCLVFTTKNEGVCLRFLLQEEDLKSSEVNDSLRRLSEPSVTERRRAARIKSSRSNGQKPKAFCLRFFIARRGFEELGSE